MDIDIHNYRRSYERAIKRVNEVKGILPINRTLITSFGEEYRQRISYPATTRYIISLYKFSLNIKKSFKKVKLKDINKIFDMMETGKIRKGNGSTYEPETIRDDKVALKQFFKFIKKKSLADKITTKKPKRKQINANLLWDEKELFKLISSVKDSVQNQALVSVMAETGTRIGELGSMKIKNVIIKHPDLRGNEILIQVSGKTGSRSLLLLWSSEYLKKWYDIHPNKNNSESPLWIRRNETGWIARSYSSLRKTFRKAVATSGVNKPSNPHIFRKSVTTNLRRKGYDVELIKRRMGWTRTSNMLEVYDAIVENDVWKEERRVSGAIEEIKKITPTVRQCPSCFYSNPAGIPKCMNCGESMNISEELNEVKKKFSIMTKSFTSLFDLFTDKKPDLTKDELEKLKKNTISVLELCKD